MMPIIAPNLASLPDLFDTGFDALPESFRPLIELDTPTLDCYLDFNIIYLI
jgi:hypothetical protein